MRISSGAGEHPVPSSQAEGSERHQVQAIYGGHVSRPAALSSGGTGRAERANDGRPAARYAVMPTGRSIVALASSASITAADFASQGTSGRRGVPTVNPTWLSAYFNGIGLVVTN